MQLHLNCILSAYLIGCTALKFKQPVDDDILDGPNAPTIQYTECREDHSYDRHKSLTQVAAEHPGVDGWCYWGFMGSWVYECAAANKMHDWSYYSDTISNGDDVLAAQGKPVNLVLVGGGYYFPTGLTNGGKKEIQSRDHIHPLDDTLCYVNGFYEVPRRKVNQFETLQRMSNEYCAYLEKVVPNYQDISMDDFWYEEYLDSDRLKLVASGQNWISLDGIWEGMLLHEAVKCLMGGVACDMAYCSRRGCMKDNTVLYDKECIGQPTWQGANRHRKFPKLANKSEEVTPPWDTSYHGEDEETNGIETQPKWYENKLYPKWWRPDLLPAWMKK